MLRILAFLTSVAIFTPSSFASSTKPFFDLVKIKRNSEGQIYEVMIRHELPFDPVNLVQENIVTTLVEQQQLGVMSNPIPMSDKKLPGEKELNEYRKIVQKILKKLKTLDLKDMFKDASLKKFLAEFKTRLIESTRDFKVIARPNDPNYFHSNKILKELLKKGLKDAKDMLPGSVAGVASYIISETIQGLIDRRTYYQNFVAHYLLSYPADALGLTEQEVEWIKSSIHESRIAWDRPWDSWDAEDKWDTYGDLQYQKMKRQSLLNWEREKSKYENAGEFYNLVFVPVIDGENLMVMNSYNLVSKIETNLSLAFDYDKPCQNISYRAVLHMVEMGMSQVAVPKLIKKEIKKFIRSLHRSQKIQEGFLAGYMMENNLPEVKYILLQSLNPMIVYDYRRNEDGSSRYRGLSCNYN